MVNPKKHSISELAQSQLTQYLAVSHSVSDTIIPAHLRSFSAAHSRCMLGALVYARLRGLILRAHE